MLHPLPARPGSSTPAVGPSTLTIIPPTISVAPPQRPPQSAHPLSQSTTPSSHSHSQTCALCSSPPKYTCPRCSTPTCSLPCTKLHKSQTPCSGIRDPTAYIPLKDVGQGVWGEDYKWLEEGRRKVVDWGVGLNVDEGGGRGGRGGRVMRGRGGTGTGRRGMGGGGREGLKRALEQRGVEVEFMPDGMGRRKMNQSGWNVKSQSLHLTIQLVIPPELLSEDTHDLSKPRLHTRVLVASSNPEEILPTLVSLLPSTVKSSLDIIFALPFHPTTHHPTPDDLSTSKSRLYYPPLDKKKPVMDVLKGTAFVEFPSIEVMEASTWSAKLAKESVAVVPLSQGVGAGRGRDSGWAGSGKRRWGGDDTGIPQPERRIKVDVGSEVARSVKPVVQVNTLAGLLAYGSDDDANEVDDDEL